ncbi:IS5 family transposase [Photorhabdus sp. RM323S]|uniref:IS5 family transposase n=1 Tax=Photorhabdus sp. RM323S TaxID=3342828 RepID=UPI0036DB380C
MLRTMLTDTQWNKLSAFMYHTGFIYHKTKHRQALEGILYRMRTGIPWRDLPAEFGKWNSVFQRFNTWSKKGVLDLIFNWLSGYSDTEWLFIDGSIVRAHQHSAGATSEADEAMGQSRGGRSTKIHLAVDSYGLPVHFELSGGQVNDIVHAESLISQSPLSDFVVANKGYDSQRLRSVIEEQKSVPVLPYRKNSRKLGQEIDKCLYRYRHWVENAFARIKHFRAIATRYDKLERNYASMLALAFIIVWLPMWTE